jgi:hypothetical protein
MSNKAKEDEEDEEDGEDGEEESGDNHFFSSIGGSYRLDSKTVSDMIGSSSSSSSFDPSYFKRVNISLSALLKMINQASLRKKKAKGKLLGTFKNKEILVYDILPICEGDQDHRQEISSLVHSKATKLFDVIGE